MKLLLNFTHFLRNILSCKELICTYVKRGT
jgi:hypothetical protein